MENKTKYILITGGSGYIGSNTAYYLVKSKSGFHPICIDLNIERKSKKVLEEAGIPLFQGNINDSSLIKEIYKQYPFEYVMHFAAYIEAGESVKYPEKFYENNVTNLEIFLATLKEINLKHFIFSSSAAVYGTYETPIEEDFNKNPCNPYGATKWKGEQILTEYAKTNNIKACSLRYFNASGAEENGLLGEEHEPETHLIPKIIQAVRSNKAIHIFGNDYPTKDGTCIRDYIHVIDLAAGHLRALEYTIESLKEGEHDYFNLGSGVGYSNQEVVKTLEKVINQEIKIEYDGRREGDPAFLTSSTAKAKDVLKWSPKKGLEDILKDAWNYHSNH